MPESKCRIVTAAKVLSALIWGKCRPPSADDVRCGRAIIPDDGPFRTAEMGSRSGCGEAESSFVCSYAS